MAFNLKKGQEVDITKAYPGLKKLVIGLGWYVNKHDVKFEFLLDASAFLLGANGKVTSDEDFVFYGNLKHKSGSVKHRDENFYHDEHDDDEQIKVDLSLVPANIEKIDFTVTIYEADVRKQTFGEAGSNVYIRIVDEMTGIELFRYDFGTEFTVETAVVVGELYRNNGDWTFSAIGAGFTGGLVTLCRRFGVNV